MSIKVLCVGRKVNGRLIIEKVADSRTKESK